MSSIRSGEVIAGKFLVEQVLGEGGMGYVVAARHLQLGQMVALKFIRDEICTPEYKSRFMREARHTVRLKSKHVARVLDVGALESGSPYMVMEHLEGIDLSNLLQQRGAFPIAEACDFIIQACEAIAEAHGYGIVHRDLKPANLFLTRGPSGEPVIKVLDFGVSKLLEMDQATAPGGRPGAVHPDTVLTKATDLLGSPSYMAPEQIVSARDADARSDVWSLGVILFRLVSGKAPFHGGSLAELIQAIMHGPIPSLAALRPDVPPGLENVVVRCLDRDKTRRIPDAAQLARMLAPFAGPVASPSLERIAILGPALVTAPPRQPSPSMHNANAWTSAPSSVTAADAALQGRVARPSPVLWILALVLMLAAMGITGVVLVRRASPATAAPPPSAQLSSAPPVVGATSTPAAVVSPDPSLAPTATADSPSGDPSRAATADTNRPGALAKPPAPIVPAHTSTPLAPVVPRRPLPPHKSGPAGEIPATRD